MSTDDVRLPSGISSARLHRADKYTPRIPQNILLWEEEQVHDFLSSLGFPGYGDQVRAEGITGEVLIHCNHEALRDLGIHSVVSRRCFV